MSTRQKGLLVIIFFTILSILFLSIQGCESKTKLSRNKAAKMIKEYKKYPVIVEGDLLIGNNIKPQIIKPLKALEKEGLIRYQFVGWDKPKISYLYNIELTDQGKEYVIKEKVKYADGSGTLMSVKLCEEKFLEVTGIKFKDNETAIVEYKWEYSNFTPFGKHWVDAWFGREYSNKTPQTSQVTFSLYDDGWRIER